MGPDSIEWILREYIGFLPGLVVALILSQLLAGRIGRAFGTGALGGWLLVMGLGIILAATVTPGHDALIHGIPGTGTCRIDRLGPPSWDELLRPNDAWLNILLFVPLGFAVGVCPRSRARNAALVLAYVLPLAIELVQLLVVALGRLCQTSDVIDNLTGLTIGVLAGAAVRWAGTVLSRPGPFRTDENP